MWRTASVVGIAVVIVAVAMAVTVVNTLDTDDAAAGKKKPCPAGMKRFVRVCIEKEPHDEQVTYEDASATCAADKRRLPTLAEIDAYRQQPNFSSLGNEWTDALTSPTTGLGLDSNIGLYEEWNLSTELFFRCVG